MDEFDVPVAGGPLRVGRWPGEGPVVLAAHGITARPTRSSDEPQGRYDRSRLTAAGLDRVTVEHVPGVNHYTILFDPHAARPGPRTSNQECRMTVYDAQITDLRGEPLDLARFQGAATLVVNVASRCGNTPQYAALESLHERYAARGFTVLGVPCNQFGGQEPGTADEIAEFCSTTYGVTFPLTEKVEVNGPGRHPLYQQLTGTPDAEGYTGDIRWNFEKFLITPAGEVGARFAPGTPPDAPEVIAAIESALA